MCLPLRGQRLKYQTTFRPVGSHKFSINYMYHKEFPFHLRLWIWPISTNELSVPSFFAIFIFIFVTCLAMVYLQKLLQVIYLLSLVLQKAFCMNFCTYS